MIKKKYSPKRKQCRKKSPKRNLSRKKSLKRNLSRKKSPKRNSCREKSPRKKSPRKKSPKRQSPKRQSKRKSKVRFMFYLPDNGKTLETQDICSICQESFIDENGIIDRQVVTCQSYHTYHLECINKSLETNNKCPLGTENITDLRQTNIIHKKNNIYNIYRTNIVLRSVENIRPVPNLSSIDPSGFINGIYQGSSLALARIGDRPSPFQSQVFDYNPEEEPYDYGAPEPYSVEEYITYTIYDIMDFLLKNSNNFNNLFTRINNLKMDYTDEAIIDAFYDVRDSISDSIYNVDRPFYDTFFKLLRDIILDFEDLTLIEFGQKINTWKSILNENDITAAIQFVHGDLTINLAMNGR